MRGVTDLLTLKLWQGIYLVLRFAKYTEKILQRYVVYPRPDALGRSGMTFQSEEGDVSTTPWSKAETPLISSVRDYVSGDPYHRIHWKSTAG